MATPNARSAAAGRPPRRCAWPPAVRIATRAPRPSCSASASTKPSAWARPLSSACSPKAAWTPIRAWARPASGIPPPARPSSRPPAAACSTSRAGPSATTGATPCSTAISSPWAIRRCRGGTGSERQPAPGRHRPAHWKGVNVSEQLHRLLAIMARLRDPESGCPWDLAQDFASIAPYTIEEAYEVADAIDRGDMAALRDELGDLLLQVVFHARMAQEAGHFGFDDVARAISEKMACRHPHAF